MGRFNIAFDFGISDKVADVSATSCGFVVSIATLASSRFDPGNVDYDSIGPLLLP